MSEHMFNFRGLMPAKGTPTCTAAVKHDRGNLVGLDAAGRATIVGGAPVLIYGRSLALSDNSTGAADAINVQTEFGEFEWLNSSTDPVSKIQVGQIVYAESEAAVCKTPGAGGGALLPAGVLCEMTVGGKAAVFVHPMINALATLMLASSRINARGAMTANVASLAAFPSVTAGTINDGVTYVKGDRVLLVNQTTAAQNGVYVVGTVGAGSAPLTRAVDMPAGQTIVNGTVVEVSEGTQYAGSSWKAMNTGTVLIGTSDPKFYPRVHKKTVTLVGGAYTLGVADLLFLFSATQSNVQPSRNVANTTTSTTGYACITRVAGISGTASAVINAQVAGGTINVADISSVDVLITNW